MANSFDGKRVLFLCLANSARSPMAELLAPRFLGAGVIATSAGARPSCDPHPYAVEVMRDVGLDLSAHRPRAVEDIDAASVDLVVLLSDEDVRSPALMDKPFVRARIADPAQHAMEFSRAMAIETFRCAREDIEDALAELAQKG